MAQDVQQVLTQELERLGVGWRIERGGRHPHIVFNWKGEELRHPFPLRNPDRRAKENYLTDFRRRLGVKREIAKADPEVRQSRREQRRKQRAAGPVERLPKRTGAATVACRLSIDPRDVLKELLKS